MTENRTLKICNHECIWSLDLWATNYKSPSKLLALTNCLISQRYEKSYFLWLPTIKWHKSIGCLDFCMGSKTSIISFLPWCCSTFAARDDISNVHESIMQFTTFVTKSESRTILQNMLKRKNVELGRTDIFKTIAYGPAIKGVTILINPSIEKLLNS